tara:strand:- start:18062 stop:19246 length:1185 start_codon:yes stop_codon:yes gene_type:complete
MDGWILGQICKKPIHFMTKGTFFSSPLKSRFLRSLGMIPINRATESKTQGVNNNSSFDACYELLESKKTLVIFPEGNSYAEKVLRELKTGTARIALEVEARNKGLANLKIIPIGLIYTDAAKFRSSAIVNVGESITAIDYIEEYQSSPREASRKLTNEFRVGMEKMLVGSSSAEHEKLVDGIIELLNSKYTNTEEKGVKKEVVLVKETYQKMNNIVISAPHKLSEITQLYTDIKLQLHQSNVKSEFLDRNYRPLVFFRQLLFSTLYIIIGIPFFLFGLLHNILPFQFADYIIPKIVKEIEYYAPVAVLLGLVIYPLNYVGFLYLIDYFFSMTFWVKFIYFFSMPVMGLFAYYYYQYMKHISLKGHFMYLMKNEKEKMKSIRKDKEKLKKMIFDE